MAGRAVNTDSRVEQFNQIIRGLCVLLLVSAFVAAFLYGAWTGKPVVSAEAFVGALMFAMQWWFKSRDEQKQRESITTTPSPAPSEASPPTGRTP